MGAATVGTDQKPGQKGQQCGKGGADREPWLVSSDRYRRFDRNLQQFCRLFPDRVRGSKPWMHRKLFVQDNTVHHYEYSRQSDEDELGWANLEHRSQDHGRPKDNAPNGDHGGFCRTERQRRERHHEVEQGTRPVICEAEWKSRIFWPPTA